MPKLSPSERGFYKQVGARIRELRLLAEGHGISQAQLARGVGVTSNTVSRWERGEYRPSMLDAQAIARFLGVPVSTLFDEDGRQNVREEIADGLHDLSASDLSELLGYIQIRGALNRRRESSAPAPTSKRLVPKKTGKR